MFQVFTPIKLNRKPIFPFQDDELTHLYTLIVRSDNTYEVRIDNKKEQSGKLEEDWDFLEPKEIPDPDAEQPETWDDNPFLDDPEDKKPEVRRDQIVNCVFSHIFITRDCGHPSLVFCIVFVQWISVDMTDVTVCKV